jgi:hypothetical protein
VESRLARVFATVADSEKQLESTAGEILALVQGAKIVAVSAWDKLVKLAYEANGWNPRAGRPTKKYMPVPTTVIQYVALVRQALRKKLRIGKYDSFTQLRIALARSNGKTDHRGGSRRKRKGSAAAMLALPAAVAESFRGVDIELEKGEQETNGALFHDLGIVYARLPENHQAMLGRQLAALLHKYLPLAQNGHGVETVQRRKAA